MKKAVLFFCCFIFIQLNAEIFIRDYTYDASELDNKQTARENALTQIKTILIEEIGVLVISELINIESEIDGKFHEVTINNTELISEGITKTEILEENWDGKQFYLKAKINIDLNDIEERLSKRDSLRVGSNMQSSEIIQIVREYNINKENENRKTEIINDLTEICKKYRNVQCFYLIGEIPNKKLLNSKKSFYIPHDEIVVLLYDETMFGSAKDGLAICGNGIYWHNNFSVSSNKHTLNWDELLDINIKYNSHTVFFGNGNKLDTMYCDQSTLKLVKLLKEIQKLLSTKYIKKYRR